MKQVRIHPRLLADIRAMAAEDRRRIGEAIAAAQSSIGQPHMHRGIGLRKLHEDYYEVRIGLDQRLVFENTGFALVFEFLGNHDGVKRFLKGM